MHKYLVLGVAFALSACASTNVMQTTKHHTPIDTGATILLLEPDTQLGVLTASGMLEPRADWTQKAVKQLTQGIRDHLAPRDHDFVTGIGEADLAPDELQLVKLHGAVGDTILQLSSRLPTKEGVFDWSLGANANRLAEAYEADYALFVTARGSYASSGRVVTSVVVAALFGTGLSLGQQTAFASLVDLRSGDIVWFNVANTGNADDMRTLAGAGDLVDSLLEDIPL